LPSESIALDTFHEDDHQSWQEIIQDEGFERCLGLAVVKQTSLARLLPEKWLNCELIEAYASLCREAGDVRILSTNVWTGVSSGDVGFTTRNLSVSQSSQLINVVLKSILVKELKRKTAARGSEHYFWKDHVLFAACSE
jgi:hypothetical protein